MLRLRLNASAMRLRARASSIYAPPARVPWRKSTSARGRRVRRKARRIPRVFGALWHRLRRRSCS